MFSKIFSYEIFGVKFLNDQFLKIFCTEFYANIALAIILKGLYFLAQMVVLLRWLQIGQQVLYPCIFPENINQL